MANATDKQIGQIERLATALGENDFEAARSIAGDHIDFLEQLTTDQAEKLIERLRNDRERVREEADEEEPADVLELMQIW